jgi:lipopolysaccharide biosynthesis glycosyltransferase
MNTGKEQLNILFSSDNNYAQHLGVAIFSLLEQNTDFDFINIYVIENDVSKENKQKLEWIIEQFENGEIIWISFAKWKKQLSLNMAWNISISTYARIFLAEMLPDNIDRVLYMDCDMIVCDSLRILWNTDLQGKVLGAIQDDISDATKSAVGLLPKDKYFNAGMLLVDIITWREQDVGRKCLEFINSHGGNVIHHDQGILNGVLKNNWYRLPLENNLMTIHYIFNLRQIDRYYADHSEFYSREEIDIAKNNPVILHYTPSFTSRPWVKGCTHPEEKRYWDIVNRTPWKDATPIRDHSKWYIKLINWRYRNLPF